VRNYESPARYQLTDSRFASLSLRARFVQPSGVNTSRSKSMFSPLEGGTIFTPKLGKFYRCNDCATKEENKKCDYEIYSAFLF
jgi:hypothetical protein